MRHEWLCFVFAFAMTSSSSTATNQPIYRKRIIVRADSKELRTELSRLGLSIERVDDGVYATDVSLQQKKLIANLGLEILSTQEILDFPREDDAFHNFAELENSLQQLAQENSDIVALTVIGRSVENRPIYWLRISENPNTSSNKPAVIFLGGHHAREHLSVEMPLHLAQHLIAAYRQGHEPETTLVKSRDIHIIPLVNPDGKEFDLTGGSYHWWRKNRQPNLSSRAVGVDLNRNYDYHWGGDGSSGRADDNTYRGAHPFSEPETQAIKDHIEQHQNISVLISFHTYSELILYPWGYTYDPINNQRDFLVHKKMAETMSQWNNYTPQQSSDLYISSGDTTDWSYGVHGIFSFTFELDPSSLSEGGFYPGAEYIERVVNKNILPSLYVLNYADNPYRVIDGTLHNALGF